MWRGYVSLFPGETRWFRVSSGGQAIVVNGSGVYELPAEGAAQVVSGDSGIDVPASVFPGVSVLEWSEEGTTYGPIDPVRIRGL